jgi:hypothetical protein
LCLVGAAIARRRFGLILPEIKGIGRMSSAARRYTMRASITIAVSLFVVLALGQAGQNQKDAKDKDVKKMELTGKLRTGIVAIGGETTGTILETKKGTFELELGKQMELRQKAEKLNGKNVTVVGKLEIRKGVEVKERRIITVTSLEEAKDK